MTIPPYTPGPGDRLLAESRAARERRQLRIITITAAVAGLIIVFSIAGWFAYQSYEEQALIEQIRRDEAIRGQPVQSEEEIRQELRNFESRYGESRSNTRALFRAFH